MKTIVILFLSCIPVGLTAQNAYIQVSCEKGATVFLDGKYSGKTTQEMEGLIIDSVSPGEHVIRMTMDLYDPVEEKITVKAGQVYLYKVNFKMQVGRIVLQSLPVSIVISIPALGINNVSKMEDNWIKDKVPVGNYPITFKWNNTIIHDTIEVRNDRITHLFANLMNKVIEDRSPSDIYLNSFRDPRDGKIYKTFETGNQLWMAENLSYATPTGSWGFDNDSRKVDVYGRLYNWETAKNVCPSGWHLPDVDEWEQLISICGGSDIAGCSMMLESGNGDFYWFADGFCKKCGFSAVPAGCYYELNGLYAFHDEANFWTSSMAVKDQIYFFTIENGKNYIRKTFYYGHQFNSVRCVKD
jgi:uncharacterized protein (TIGR02145 family)